MGIKHHEKEEENRELTVNILSKIYYHLIAQHHKCYFCITINMIVLSLEMPTRHKTAQR